MFKLYYILTYPLTFVCLILILIYKKLLTHGKGKCCHFYPTCSEYAYQSIREFGAIWGGILSIKRILSCTPKNHGGVDFIKLNLLGNYKWKC